MVCKKAAAKQDHGLMEIILRKSGQNARHSQLLLVYESQWDKMQFTNYFASSHLDIQTFLEAQKCISSMPVKVKKNTLCFVYYCIHIITLKQTLRTQFINRRVLISGVTLYSLTFAYSMQVLRYYTQLPLFRSLNLNVGCKEGEKNLFWDEEDPILVAQLSECLGLHSQQS